MILLGIPSNFYIRDTCLMPQTSSHPHYRHKTSKHMCLRTKLLQVSMLIDCYLLTTSQVDETPNNEVQTSTILTNNKVHVLWVYMVIDIWRSKPHQRSCKFYSKLKHSCWLLTFFVTQQCSHAGASYPLVPTCRLTTSPIFYLAL